MQLFEKAVLQVVMGCGLIKDSDLESYYGIIVKDFNVVEPPTLPGLFQVINTNIKRFSFEIKSVILLGEDGKRVYYHGYVNTEADTVAITNGGNLSEKDLAFFKEILSELLMKSRLSTREIEQLPPHGLTKVQINQTLQKLFSQHWLRKNDRNLWEIGPRTYLELTGYLENTIRAKFDAERDGEELDQELLDRRMREFPQIVYY